MTAHLIAEDGSLQGLILPLTGGDEWIIGRSSDVADLVVDDSTVSRKHAKLNQTAEGIFLTNLSKVNPTLINNEESKDPTLLKEGDHVQIGETTFLFSEEKIPNLSEDQTLQQNTDSTSEKTDYNHVFENLDHLSEDLSPQSKNEDITKQISRDHNEEPPSYDTVFEDASEENQVPFNLPPTTPFLLKVVSGPNAGAEIGIEKGRAYILGKDPQVCDILFQDLSVSRSHAQLRVDDQGTIEIEDLGSKNGTSVNGSPITQKQTLSSQDLIALGTTIFLILDREAPQETIYAPLLPSNETIATTDQNKQEIPLEKNWKEYPIPYKHLILAGSIALVFLITFFSFFSLFKSKTIEVVQKEPISEIRDALSAKKFSNLEFSFNPATGKLFLTGHVITAVDYQEMRYQLSLVPFIMSIEDTVIIDDGVCKMMNDVLSANPLWQSISLRCIEPGKFLLTGYLQTTGEMNSLSEYVMANFPYQNLLENRVAVEELLSIQISSLLMQQGFSSVSYQLNNGEIILSGVYNELKEEEYKELIKELKEIQSINSVKNFASPTSPHMAAINLTSQFNVSGISFYEGHGFNTILNGKIYSLGDLVDGMKIINIEENTILLEKDGVKYRIDYTR
jgi:type III secretion system YscD/HrpQ family protein